jgi:hypothetical protein
MFARSGVTGLAVVLGSASGGLACRDWDDAGAYHRWADDHPGLAATLPTVQTPRGFHVYFAGPEGYHELGDGEYRADAGHYCLLPPSLHPDGMLYRWLIPLPEGALPFLDPAEAGLLTQDHEDTSLPTYPHTQHVSPCDTSGVETAILATLPTGPGQRNSRLFDLARRLKRLMPDAMLEELEPIVRTWHSRALQVIRTKDWLDTWIKFRHAWSNAKRPFGAKFAEIVATAKARTPSQSDAIQKLVELCRAISEHHGPGQSWPLSCRIAGAAIGTSHKTAAAILKLLCVEGVIALVKPAGPKKSGQAAEYRLIEER